MKYRNTIMLSNADRIWRIISDLSGFLKKASTDFAITPLKIQHRNHKTALLYDPIKKWRNRSWMKQAVATLATVIMTFVIIMLGSSKPVSAASTLSITISTNTLSTDVIPANASGTFSTSNAADISVTTDHYTGYTLGIKAGTTGENTTGLVNTADNAKSIVSIPATITEADFSASANTQYNNKWGYKPSKFNSVANTTNYYPAPSASGDTLDATSTSNATANTYNISFGTRIGLDTTPGTYSNTYVITAVVNPTPYSITYDKNTADTVINMPSPNPDSGSTYDDHVVISSFIPVRDGYEFVSWCTSNSIETSCDSTSYQPDDNYSISQTANAGNTTTLYAIWSNVAMLDTGQIVNQKLKKLAGNNSATYSTQDNTITALVRSGTLPTGFTPTTNNTISANSSPTPIYAWYDSENTTIYYYSESADIKMNQDSGYFFYNMRALSNLSTISTWDSSSVTSMNRMLYAAGYNAASFSLDLSSWDSSNVTSMALTFYFAGRNADNFTLNLSSWDTSNVESMYQMFYYAGYSATTWSIGGLSSWDTSKVTTMYYMFNNAGRSANTFILDLSSWDTSNVESMYQMFYYAGYSATTWSIGDLSSWDTSKVTTMARMFDCAGHNAASFTLDLSSWDTSSVTDMSYIFNAAGKSATTWSIGDLSSWDTSKVTNMSRMFYNAGYNDTTWSVGSLSSWDTSSATLMSGMFNGAGYSATTWSVGNLSSWDTSSVINMSYMFYFAGYSATTFDISYVSSWDTSSVTNMECMFNDSGYSATTWSIGDLSSWNTSKVTNMYSMFSSAGYNATSFTLDISSWDTSSVTNMNQMFHQAGYSATTWSITIPKTNNGTATGAISNTTSNLYGNSTSVTATPPSGKSFTLAN